MKLYKLLFEHWSQKDSERGIKGFFVAEDNEAAYEFVKNCEKLDYNNPLHVYTSWAEYEATNSYHEDEDESIEKGFDIYNDDYECIGTETFKERMIRLGGEMFDEDQELNDLYYGATRYGWECIGKILPTEIAVLKNVGILK